MAQEVIESSLQSWVTCAQPETPDPTPTLLESYAEREARTIVGSAVIAEHLRQEATQGYARARGLEARARALDDATTARARALAVDLDEAARRLAAHPYAIKRTQPDALSHAPSPDAAPVDGAPEPEALAEKMINAAGQWITLNSKTTKKTSIEETTTTVMIRGKKAEDDHRDVVIC